MKKKLQALLVLVVIGIASIVVSAEDSTPTRQPYILAPGPASYDALKIGPRAILREGPNDWKMWYEAAPAGNQSCVGYATSNDGVAWTKYSGNPIMCPTEAWEGFGGSNHETSPRSVIKENGVYHMWYHGIQGTSRKIGYATSTDCLVWTKYAGNPVLSPGPTGAWDADSIAEPNVIKVGNTYMMYYTHATGTHGIGLATSTDRVTWTKYGTSPVIGITQSWESQKVAFSNIYFDGVSYHAWYVGQSNWVMQLGYASSTDGRTWVKSSLNPILKKPNPALGYGDDRGLSDGATVLRIGSQWRIYYGGMQSCCPEQDYLMLGLSNVQSSPNNSPIVDAGANRLVQANQTIALDGTVQDDDVPVTLSSVASTWSVDSGPGSVSFGSPNSPDTSATFSAAGTYVIRLTANDSALSSYATATITVVNPCN